MAFEEWPGAAARGENWLFSSGRGRGRERRRRKEELEQLALLRHFRGGPPFGAGPLGPRFGGGRGRARRGEVRIALLRLLAEEPRNGYQLMQAIEERSGGRWRPSPGSVYPTLAQLEDEGLIRSTLHDGSKRYEITDGGRQALEGRLEETAPWEAGDEQPFSELQSLAAQVQIAALQVAQAGNEGQIERATKTLAETRRALYRVLAEDVDA